MNKITCSLLALLMAISPLSAFALKAAPIVPPGNTPVTLNTTPLTFNATVPTGLPLSLDANGVVTPATEASIINNSIGPIKVVSVTTTSVDSWILTNYTDDFSTKKVNSKDIALQFNKDNVTAAGSIALTPQNWPTMAGSDSLKLDYQGKLAPQSTGFTKATAANVSFVLDWDDTPISETDIEDTTNPEYSFTIGDIKTINFSFKNSKNDKVVFTSSNPEVATVELVDNSHLRLVSGIKSAKITAISNGTTTITGTLEDGTSSSIEVVVTDKAVKGLVVKSPASKTSYIEGENFDATGLVIEAIINNGSSDIVTNYTLSNNTNLVIGQAEVILSYSGHEISLPITVVAKSISSLTIATQPTKTVYKQGSTFDATGLKLRVNYNNNTSVDIGSGWTITNGDSLITGQTSVTVNYGGKSVDVPITVDKYVLATDADFSDTKNGAFKYIGTDKYVEVPHVIKGVPVTSYYGMFVRTSVEGVKSTNINVTDMREMFRNSTATTLDLSNFDTSNVTTMKEMFNESTATTLDVSNFDTSKVTDMREMFRNSTATTLDLSNFDTSKVTDMREMFRFSQATELDLSNFDTSNVTDMYYMFQYSKATTLDLSSFNTSNVTTMNYMFAYSQATTLDLSSFNTSNVTTMFGMFENSDATKLNLSNFDTSKVTDMGNMFLDSSAYTLDLSNFDTSDVTDMSSMFKDSQATTLDLSNFNTANVTDMSSMFKDSKATTLDLSNFNTANVTDMASMFEYSKATTFNVSSFNTSSVTNMNQMFDSSKATTLDLSSFDTSKVTDMAGMFDYSKATTGYARTQTDANKFNASSNKPSTLTFRVK